MTKSCWKSMVLVLVIGLALLVGMPGAASAAGVQVTPNANGDIDLRVLVAAIDPYLTSVDGQNFGNGQKRIRASEYNGFSLKQSVDFWVKNFTEVSHGTVKISVVDTVVLDEFPAYKSMASFDNVSYQKLFKKRADGSGYGDWYKGVMSDAYQPYAGFWGLDYEYYVKKLNLVARRNANEFDLVLLVGIDPLMPAETCMVGRKAFYINGLPLQADCDNFVIVTPTFSRKDGSIENVGHLAEQMLGHTYGMIEYVAGSLDGSDYSKLNDWQKYCLCKFLDKGNAKVYGYGMMHFSPNSEKDYEWYRTDSVSYYKDWKNGTDIQDFTANNVYAKDSFFNYQNINDSTAHHRWWFYNLPYENGRDSHGYYKNWWRYIFTPDYVTKVLPKGTGILTLEVGQTASLNFNVQYYSGKTVATTVPSSGAAVKNHNTQLISVSRGQVTAKALGQTTVDVKIDGKTATFTIKVVEHNFAASTSTQHKCTICGALENHSYTTVCKDKCAVCGQVNANSRHVAVIDSAVEAGCTEDGWTEGSHCKYCNVVLVKQERVFRHGHWYVLQLAVEPTCTKPGSTQGSVCKYCGLVRIASESIPATGHTVVKDKAVAATTYHVGYTEGSHCSVCQKVLKAQQVIPKLVKFTDVDDSKYYAESVYFLRDRGTMTGFSDTIFGVGKDLKRESMIALLWKNEGKPSVSGVSNPFKDVKSSKYYYKAILWGVKNRIAKGYSGGEKAGCFGVNDPISRQDFVIVLYSYAQLKGYDTTVKSASSYLVKRDAKDVSSYARIAVNWGYEKGLIGKQTSPLEPKKQISRQDAAVIIASFLRAFER